MTDMDRLREVLDDWGVPYEIEAGDLTVTNEFVGPEHPKVTGYRGFLTRFEFDDNFTFLRMGAWE